MVGISILSQYIYSNFQLIFLSKPDFNSWSSFALSWVDKVTTGKESFVSVFENVARSITTSVKTITQISDLVKIRLILQLIKGI